MAFWDFLRRGRAEERRLDGLSVPTWSEVSQGEISLVGGGDARALSLIPVFASCRLLAGTVSTLPIRTYRDQPDGTKQSAPQAQLFQTLEKSGQLVPWLHACMTSLCLRGNAYGQILDRDGYGYPTQIEWADPATVKWDPGKYDDSPRGWRINGVLVSEPNVLHIPWFTLPGRKEGLSPIGAFATTIGAGINAAQYGSDWFANGGFPPGTFRNTEQPLPNPAEANAIKQRLKAAIQSRQPLVMGKDWEYTPVSVPPAEAQFIETQRLNATQVASIYGIPAEMVGGDTGKSMTYHNVEQQQIQFVTLTLRPWLVVLEKAFTAQLPDRQYVKFNADALIRADTRTRHEAYQIERTIGLRSIDELRALEDLPPLPNGEGSSYLPTPTAPVSLASDSSSNVRSLDWSRPA